MRDATTQPPARQPGPVPAPAPARPSSAVYGSRYSYAYGGGSPATSPAAVGNAGMGIYSPSASPGTPLTSKSPSFRSAYSSMASMGPDVPAAPAHVPARVPSPVAAAAAAAPPISRRYSQSPASAPVPTGKPGIHTPGTNVAAAYHGINTMGYPNAGSYPPYSAAAQAPAPENALVAYTGHGPSAGGRSPRPTYAY
eukprot:RCo032332